MSENMKSGIILLAALLLGGLLVAGLVQQVELGRAGKPKPETQNPAAHWVTEPAVSPPANTAPAQPAVEVKPAVSIPANVPPAQSIAKQALSLVPKVNRESPPTVDFFGKPLDAFGIEVNERVGIAGQVVMAGRPVPGATVLLRRVSRKIADGAPDYTGVAADPSGGPEWTTVTDANGKYAFYGLDDGHYGLSAHTDSACGVEDMTIREGSIPGRLSGKIAYFAGRAHMTIELWPSGALSGLVLTPEGQPVAGAVIYPYEIQFPTGSMRVEPVPQVMLSVKSGEDGVFQFPRLPAGRWRLAIGAPGYADRKTDWLSTGGQSAEIRLNRP